MMSTRFKMWPLLSLVLMTFVTVSECSSIGKHCSSRNFCGIIDIYYKCQGGYCYCSEPNYVRYNEKATENCQNHPFFPCFSESCPANSSCVGLRCQCNEGYLRVENECKKGYPQKVLESCYVANDGNVFFCDSSKYSICQSGRCICFDQYFPNTTSGLCEHQSSYLKLHKLLEYRVKPGVYCKDGSDCISGLTCKNFTCSCPSACSYNSTQEVCDCGEVPPKEISVGPIVVGILVGIGIIIFWYKKIKNTFQRFKDKKSDQTSAFSTVPSGSPTHNSYSLNPTQSPSAALYENSNTQPASPAGLYVNQPSGNGRQSPMAPPGAEPLPAKEAEPNSLNLPYSVNPTELTPHPIIEAGAPPNPIDFSQPPPPYSQNATDAPPPYSSDLPPVSFSAPIPPYSVNSTYPLNSNPMPSAPDPSNPSATPLPSDPIPSPFPSNPSATPYPLYTYDTSYPSNSYVAPLSPYHERGDGTTPPAYNPAYDGNKP